MTARVTGATIHPVGRLYVFSRHFVWTGPLVNLVLFLTIGVILALAVRFSPRVAGWFGPRLLCALTILPALMAAEPRIYPMAWALLSFGFAVLSGPWLARRAPGLERSLWFSFPVMVIAVAGLAASVLLDDRLKEMRARNRPVPPAATANVLLVVLDTVRADHLSLYGYPRPTTPNIDRLAARGIRFDEARASAPWTLPSHATMLTGRWPHELGAEWKTPLLGGHPPTLAEYLGAHGYATAGFVANDFYCSYATHLDRGFAHYEDFVMPRLVALRTAGLVEYLLEAFLQLTDAVEGGPILPVRRAVFHWFALDQRKYAASINRSFVDWLSRSRPARRPYFAFLNYIDAHSPYTPSPGMIHRFGSFPRTADEKWIVYEKWPLLDRTMLQKPLIDLGRDAYDDGLGYIDDQIGWLVDELARCGELDRTLLIVTSDHGEGFGEHDLFEHGESLYRTEIRVPLVIVPPGGGDGQRVVKKTVSLRDLPATIVNLVGLADGSPFPGQSLAAAWREQAGGHGFDGDEPVLSELAAPNPINPNSGRSPASRGPLVSIAQGDFVYIRNEKDDSEQLFDIQDDPRELTNRAQNDRFQATLERFRSLYNECKSGGPPVGGQGDHVARNQTGRADE